MVDVRAFFGAVCCLLFLVAQSLENSTPLSAEIDTERSLPMCNHGRNVCIDVGWCKRKGIFSQLQMPCFLSGIFCPTIALTLCLLVTFSAHGESFQEMKERAEQGDVSAYHDLGNLYFFGEGVKKDAVTGVKWYRKAAEHGDVRAQHALGLLYLNGQCVKQNFTESVRWFRKSAEQNFYFSQHALGNAYSKGEGVAQNDSLAMMWYHKAAKHSYKKSELMLGLVYYSGNHGVKQDFIKAAKWFHKAAEHGEALAQYMLCSNYQNCLYFS